MQWSKSFFLSFSLSLMAFAPSFTLSDSNTAQSTCYLFAHGIAAMGNQAQMYAAAEILGQDYTTFSFPDSKGFIANVLRVNPFLSDFGQDGEQKAFDKALKKAISKEKNIGVILAALSRGSVVAFNYIALNKPDSIKAAVLESPFDSFMNLMRDKYSYPIMQNIVRNVFLKHDIKGIQPSKVAKDYPTALPTLLVSSQEDYALKATQRLYKKLHLMGHEKVHLLILNQGKHGHLIDGPDSQTYKQITHAFYKHYNLEHNPVLAEQGKELFATCKPKP